MKVYFTGSGPGSPDLLTVKAHRALTGCRIIIYAGSLVSPGVLALVPADAEKHDSAGMSLDEILEVCREARDRHVDVVRLHSGDPSLYGAIREQMNGLDALGIEYEVIPGVSAFQAAAACLKSELTAPETAQAVILTRTAGRTPLPEEQELERLARSRATLCIYLSGHAVEETVGTLIPFYGSDCHAAVVFHASWPDEKIVRSTLENIAGQVAAADLGRTSVIIVGLALDRDLPASRLYDPSFSHGFRKGSGS